MSPVHPRKETTKIDSIFCWSSKSIWRGFAFVGGRREIEYPQSLKEEQKHSHWDSSDYKMRVLLQMRVFLKSLWISSDYKRSWKRWKSWQKTGTPSKVNSTKQKVAARDDLDKATNSLYNNSTSILQQNAVIGKYKAISLTDNEEADLKLRSKVNWLLPWKIGIPNSLAHKFINDVRRPTVTMYQLGDTQTSPS